MSPKSNAPPHRHPPHDHLQMNARQQTQHSHTAAASQEAMQAAAKHESRCERLTALVAEAKGMVEGRDAMRVCKC